MHAQVWELLNQWVSQKSHDLTWDLPLAIAQWPGEIYSLSLDFNFPLQRKDERSNISKDPVRLNLKTIL